MNNSDADVAFITNYVVDHDIEELFQMHGINIIKCPFDCFKFEDDYPWCLAFYKLCAVKYALCLHYDNILCLDTDIFTKDSFSYLWGNLKRNIVLYDRVGSTLKPLDSLESLAFVRYSYDMRVQRVGGEFIAGSVENLHMFIDAAEKVFLQMKEHNIRVESGDEYITSLAAAMLYNVDLSGGRIITRLETGPIRNLCPLSQLSITPIMHVPSEKRDGMLCVFQYIVKNSTIPSEKLAYRYYHIYHRSAKAFLKAVIKRILIKNNK